MPNQASLAVLITYDRLHSTPVIRSGTPEAPDIDCSSVAVFISIDSF